MPIEITMPQQSDTMTEGTLVKWLKKEGDKVKAGETVAEVETDKATMEMESFDGGTLAAILLPEGQKAAVGAVIAVLAKGTENPADVKKQYASGAKAKSAAPAPQSLAVSRAASAESPPPASAATATALAESPNTAEMKEPDHADAHACSREPATAVPALSSNGNGAGRVRVSPLARRIAADKNIDLTQVKGSGPAGRIVQQDILNFQPTPKSASPAGTDPKSLAVSQLPQLVPSGQSEKIPLTKMRAAIATALQRSKQNVPHFYVSIDVDVEELTTLRARLNKRLESQGLKLSVNDFVSKAVAAALRKHPALNAHFTGDAVTRFGDVNLGIAVAIPDGLIVPVIRSADQMGLVELQQRTAELAKKAKAQKLKGDEMKGATFTISNLGMFGVKDFQAIINPPEVAILAVAAAEKRPVIKGDQVVPRTMMTLTISVDHRAVDGATAAEFLRTLKGMLEEPAMMVVDALVG
jgi:pyruvate dehydrogenase E2 component (dihydrolipoamide acetyltransferase)